MASKNQLFKNTSLEQEPKIIMKSGPKTSAKTIKKRARHKQKRKVMQWTEIRPVAGPLYQNQPGGVSGKVQSVC